MKNLLIRWVLLSLLCATAAHADIRFERFIPTNPTSDFAPTAEIWVSGSTGLTTCDTVGTIETLVADSLVVTGQNVHLQIPVARYPTSSGAFCFSTSFFPRTWRYPLSRLSAGSYTLEIIGRDIKSPERPNFPIATVPFVVSVGDLVDVPLLTGWSFALLLVAILVIGLLSSRQKLLNTFSFLILAGNSLASPSPVVTERYTIEITLRSGANRTTADALVSNGINGRFIAALANPALSDLRLAQSQRPTGAYQNWLNARPNIPAAVLTRIAFADVPDRASAEAIVTALRLNADVQSAYLVPKVQFSAGPPPSPSQEGQVAIRVDLARRWQSGWALMGSVDTGIQTNHPKLAAFDGTDSTSFRDSGNYQGGNFLWAYAGDDVFGGRDVDERSCVSIYAKGVDSCIPFSLTFPGAHFWSQECPVKTVQSSYVGHGTHQVGIAVANGRDNIAANAGLDFFGVCAGCSLAMRKASKLDCANRIFFPNDEYADPVVAIPLLSNLVRGIDNLIDSGVQVISLSFESVRDVYGPNNLPVRICGSNTGIVGSVAMCSALQMAHERGVIVVAAAGNGLGYLAFPASEPDVLPAMGFNPGAPIQYWQVGTNPMYPPFSGSSYGVAKPFTEPSQANYLGYSEMQAPAFEIRSTFYFGQVWSREFGCESFDHNLSSAGIGPASNASYFGICSGTSMAAPALAGVAALVRSTNPLLPVGDSAFVNAGITPAVGVRDVLARTGREDFASGNVALVPAPQPPLAANIPAQQAWGFGIVNAEAALIKTMGTVAGQTVKHRLTPLFQLRSSANNDFAYTTSPQSAIALTANDYFSPSSTALVRGFASFMQSATLIGDTRYAPAAPLGSDYVPHADFFILANDYRSSVTQLEPDMPLNIANANLFRVEPLFWLSRCRTNGSVGCGLAGAEFLVALERELTQLNSLGYELRGRIGFVIACKTASCASGAPNLASVERVYRAWKGSDLNLADAAFIGTSQLGSALYSGYSNQTAPAGVPVWPEVYAFKNSHSDSDDLIDAQEVLAGSNEMASDGDCDGLADSTEYPVAGVPQSDPMANNTSCADMRILKVENSGNGYTVINPIGPNPAGAVLVTLSYAGSTDSTPLGATWPVVPSGWKCIRSTTYGAQNSFQATAKCSRAAGIAFAIGERIKNCVISLTA